MVTSRRWATITSITTQRNSEGYSTKEMILWIEQKKFAQSSIYLTNDISLWYNGFSSRQIVLYEFLMTCLLQNKWFSNLNETPTFWILLSCCAGVRYLMFCVRVEILLSFVLSIGWTLNDALWLLLLYIKYRKYMSTAKYLPRAILLIRLILPGKWCSSVCLITYVWMIHCMEPTAFHRYDLFNMIIT